MLSNISDGGLKMEVISSKDKMPFMISYGPAKEALAVSVLEGNPAERTFVGFVVGYKNIRVDVAITVLGQESGSGYDWNFEGYTKIGGHAVEGYYNSKTCVGCFTAMKAQVQEALGLLE